MKNVTEYQFDYCTGCKIDFCNCDQPHKCPICLTEIVL